MRCCLQCCRTPHCCLAAAGQRAQNAELPDSCRLFGSRPKRQALAPSCCNLTPDFWPACLLSQSQSLPADSRLTGSTDTPGSLSSLSFSLERHGRCDEAAPGTSGTTEGLRKSPSRSSTPMLQGQQFVPNHTPGLMPSSFTWGSLADPMYAR